VPSGRRGAPITALEPSVARIDQDNTTVFFGDRFALKFLRKIEEGPHPEQEIGSLLTQIGFPNVPPLAGALEYRDAAGEPMLVAVLQGFVREGMDAWQYTLNHLGSFFEHAVARGPAGPPAGVSETELARELIGPYLETVRLLGTRTAELHLALASRVEDPAFAPEAYTDFYRRGLYHGMLGRQGRACELLRANLNLLPESARADASAVLERQAAIRVKLRYLRDERITAGRIRIHGDFHLAQVLYTGKDVMMIDFEGDTARPLSERRIKRSPLQDVAGMLDSFYHASHGALFGEAPGVIPKPETLNALEIWAKFWYQSVSSEYLGAYLAAPGIAPLLPSHGEQIRAMLRIFLLDLALRKLAYEVTHAPERIRIPSHAIVELIEAS
jgi:maltose alpha-D-glucosyltransferase/alpha-amylase